MEIKLEDLKESNEFLNLLLNMLNSAVLIVDEDLKIYRFNNCFLTLFEDSPKEVTGNGFGQAMGCIHTIDENMACGETSHCDNCLMRRSLIETVTANAPIDKQRLEKEFYVDGKSQKKYLEFSTRPISFQGRKMVMVIFYDVTQIESQKIKLQKQQIQIEKDLEAAAGIQKSLLPDTTSGIKNIEIAWKFEPCSRVGGDIFNICYPDEKHAGFYILDVCGHGVSAALISVAVSQFLRGRRGSLVNEYGITSPEAVLNSLNQTFPFERFDSYFSTVYMIIDHTKGLLTYGCAGHPPPVLIRRDKTLEVLDHHGPVIGIDISTSFSQEEKVLQGGDKILLYTDGIVESCNPTGETFGKPRFYEILQNHSHQPIQDLVEAVYSGVKNFRKTALPEDDISILGIEYAGDK
jgi:sigma-B regulation protein RsbU (phosphoserine phosphatase)